MKRSRIFCTATTILISAFSITTPNLAFAQSIEVNAAASEVNWNAGISGVSLIFAADGSMDRMISTYRQPVNIPDSRGIRTAQVIAEERAKAAIIRFINEEITSERIVTQIQNDLNSTRFTEGSAGTTLSNETSRQIVENVTELTRSSAQGLLSGIVVLEQGYDEGLREAWVTVGISKKSRGSAALVSDWLKDAPVESLEPATNAPEGNDTTLPGSSVQRNTGNW